MIDGKRILGVIPARGGSKGLPGKNIRPLAGKPLIAWAIEAAAGSRYLDRVIVSSENPEIIKVAKKWRGDVPFVRPAELSRDETPGIEPVLHAIEALPGYDYVVLLQPTSPLRTAADIDGCIEECLSNRAKTCVSVTEQEKSPAWMFTLDAAQQLIPVVKVAERPLIRQSAAKVYTLNGAVYVAEISWLLEQEAFVTEGTRGYPMPKLRSVDVDTDFDWLVLEAIVNQEHVPG